MFSSQFFLISQARVHNICKSSILRSNHAHDKIGISDWKGQKIDGIDKKWVTSQLQTVARQTSENLEDGCYDTRSEAYTDSQIAIDYLIVAAMLHYTKNDATNEESNLLITPEIQKSSKCGPNLTGSTTLPPQSSL